MNRPLGWMQWSAKIFSTRLFARMWLGALAVCPLVYQLIAADAVLGLKHKQGSTQMSIFDATRPLRCDQMLASKLFAVVAWSGLSFCLLVLAASLHSTLEWLAAGVSLPLMFVSTTVVLMSAVYWWSRFPDYFAWLIYFGIAHILLFTWDVAHEHPLRWLWLVYAYLIPLAVSIVSLWGLWVGVRAGARTPVFGVGRASAFANISMVTRTVI